MCGDKVLVAALVHVFRQSGQHGAGGQVQLVQVVRVEVVESRLARGCVCGMQVSDIIVLYAAKQQ